MAMDLIVSTAKNVLVCSATSELVSIVLPMLPLDGILHPSDMHRLVEQKPRYLVCVLPSIYHTSPVSATQGKFFQQPVCKIQRVFLELSKSFLRNLFQMKLNDTTYLK